DDAGAAAVPRRVAEELHGEVRLAAARPAAAQRRPAAWQPAPRDLVQALNARRGLGHGAGESGASRVFSHSGNLRALHDWGSRAYLFFHAFVRYQHTAV